MPKLSILTLQLGPFIEHRMPQGGKGEPVLQTVVSRKNDNGKALPFTTKYRELK